MARKYKRLSYEDRKRIEAMCKAGSNAETIADAVGVHRGTLYRELQRGGAENGKRQQYSAELAQRAIIAKKFLAEDNVTTKEEFYKFIERDDVTGCDWIKFLIDKGFLF